MGREKAETGLAGRYANAVFELAREQKAVDAVSADLATLRRATDASADLAHLLKSPVFSRDEQARALKPVLAKLGTGALTTQFLLLLAAKRRLFALAEIIAAYERLVAQTRSETHVEVTAARDLDEGELVQIRAALKNRLGREPRLHTSTDSALLGGLVVKIGSRMIDSSIRTKLLGLRAAMKGN